MAVDCVSVKLYYDQRVFLMPLNGFTESPEFLVHSGLQRVVDPRFDLVHRSYISFVRQPRGVRLQLLERFDLVLQVKLLRELAIRAFNDLLAADAI